MTDDDSRLDELERRMGGIERMIEAMARVWMPRMRDALRELREAPVPAGRRPRPYHRTYKDYVVCNYLKGRGMSIRRVSLVTGIAYSTCHNYFFLEDGEIERLRLAWEKVNPPFREEDVDPDLYGG